MASFGTYAVGFFARPLGGIVFGHYGDKIGRKSMLVTTLVMMGLSTFLIGTLPTYDQIGPLAPVVLVIAALRPGARRGRRVGRRRAAGGRARTRTAAAASTPAPPRRACPAGMLLANGAFAAVVRPAGRAVPELGLARAVPGRRPLVGDRPVHPPAHPGDAAVRQGPSASGLRAACRCSIWCASIPGTCSWRWAPASPRTPASTCSRSSSTPTSASGPGISRDTILQGVLIASALQLFTIPGFAALSDRVGRRPGLSGRGAVHGAVRLSVLLAGGHRRAGLDLAGPGRWG